MKARDFVHHMTRVQNGRPRFKVRRKQHIGDELIDVTVAVVSDDGRLCIERGEVQPEEIEAFVAWCREVFDA